jgi:hypothetical protein
VGFIPPCWTHREKVQHNIAKFVVVKELYRESSNSCKHDKSARNVGMCSVISLDNIPRNE